MDGIEEINGQLSYITLAEADDYMTVNVSVSGWTVVDEDLPDVEETPLDAEKENYILSAYQEINPDSVVTIAEGKRTQLDLLAAIYNNPTEFYEAKTYRVNKVKSFKNSKLAVTFSDTNGGGGNSNIQSDDGSNGVVSL